MEVGTNLLIDNQLVHDSGRLCVEKSHHLMMTLDQLSVKEKKLILCKHFKNMSGV